MILPQRINTNINGIPSISSQSVTVNTTANTVAYNFLNHPNVGAPYRGWLTVRIAQEIPAGTAGTVELVFTTEGQRTIPVIGYNGANATVANLRGTGVYLFWYESQTGYLQLVTGDF